MTTTTPRNSFVLYTDNHDIFCSLTKDQKADLIDAIFIYQKTGELPTDPIIKVGISSFISQFKRDSQKWEKTCQEKTTAGKMGNLKRWHPQLYKKVIDGKTSLDDAMQGLQPVEPSQPDRTQSDPIGEVANIAVNDSVNVSVNDIIKTIKPAKKSKPKPKDFTPPTLQEVKDFCQGRKSSVNPVGFLDYYTTSEWKDANNKEVKNWKLKLITWENRNTQTQTQSSDSKFSAYSHLLPQNAK